MCSVMRYDNKVKELFDFRPPNNAEPNILFKSLTSSLCSFTHFNLPSYLLEKDIRNKV